MDNLQGFVVDDQCALGPLNDLGIGVEEVSWRSKRDWDCFDAVIIRSTWDYQRDTDSFLIALQDIAGSRADLYNSIETVRWNIDKSYLRKLEEAGILTVPTIWIDELSESALFSLMHDLECRPFILKPTVGANADDTFRLTPGWLESDPSRAQQLIDTFHNRPCLAQPFIASITRLGEYSLFYFNSQFSHSILKTPAAGDFRVQEEHGGTIRWVTAPKSHLAVGQAVMDYLPLDCLYARVDLADLDSGEPAIMELELIEPSLYFRFDNLAAERFASAIATRLSKSS